MNKIVIKVIKMQLLSNIKHCKKVAMNFHSNLLTTKANKFNIWIRKYKSHRKLINKAHLKMIVLILGEAFHLIWKTVLRKYMKILYKMRILIIVQIKLIRLEEELTINHFKNTSAKRTIAKNI
jgi:hypothetical protein